MCHCYSCQRRSGSTFAVQARFPADRVRIEGRHTAYERISDGGEGRTFSFCPECGATVFYTTGDSAELIAVPVGAFADRGFPPPTISVWEKRMHPWVGLPDGMEHIG
jgi:hypothetical protein